MQRARSAGLLASLSTATLLLAAPAARALTLGFGDATCGGGGACSDTLEIDESYGDLPGLLDVLYDRDLASGVVGPLTFWGAGYGSLDGVAFGEGIAGTQVAEIFLSPLGSASVRLLGFDLGSWQSQARETQVTLLDGDDGVLWSSGAITVEGVTHLDFDLESESGIKIQWGPTAYYVGIDNLSFEVVPEPSSAALLALGLAALGLRGREAPKLPGDIR